MTLIKILLYLLLLILILLPSGFFLLLSKVVKRFSSVLSKYLKIIGLSISGIIVLALSYGYFVGRTDWQIKQVDFSYPTIPLAFEGYRILQISDIHIPSWSGEPEIAKEFVKLVNDQHPDLIVFTGDLVTFKAEELDELKDTLSQITARDGVYSILGNHDEGPYYLNPNPEEIKANRQALLEKEASMGWTLLNNSHVLIHHQGDSIALIGVENDGEPPFGQHAKLQQATEGTDSLFQILLSHNPTHWRRKVLSTTKIPLMLAGHTHAFQMQIGSWSPAQYKYPEWSGFYYEGQRALYVNIGAGEVGLPCRIGARPEITIITLHKSL
ncbi:MAG: metallophosphoesterase [Bacteroidaceae bacterium]